MFAWDLNHGENAGQSIRVISSFSSSSINSKSLMWPCIAIHKNESGPMAHSGQTPMGEEAPSHNRDPRLQTSIENVELSSPVQHNASPDKNSRTAVAGVLP
ncbi:hypothetical protein TNCV_502111 [Trichonephila clavipes]|nr:hypothetical protein TNCV_502111 [Trichonephila clavipes]